MTDESHDRLTAECNPDADEITLVENPVELAVVADIAAMRNRGMKLKQIANDLSERDIPTKTGNSQWSHQAVASILKRT